MPKRDLKKFDPINGEGTESTRPPKGTSVYGNKSCDKLIVIIDPCGMDAINIKRKVD